MTLKGPAHGPGLDGSIKAYWEKAFFTEPLIFRYDSCEQKIDLELGGWGQKIIGGNH